jgi:hypothetical protein
VNIQPHQFPQSHVYVSLWKSGGPRVSLWHEWAIEEKCANWRKGSEYSA